MLMGKSNKTQSVQEDFHQIFIPPDNHHSLADRGRV